MSDAQIREATIRSIQEAVARLFDLPVDELRQESTRRAVAVPRQIAIYLAKLMTDASLPEIGRHFGGRHHTTVMHSIAKVHNFEEHRLRTRPCRKETLNGFRPGLKLGSLGFVSRLIGLRLTPTKSYSGSGSPRSMRCFLRVSLRCLAARYHYVIQLARHYKG
jgi:hypothetical protein